MLRFAIAAALVLSATFGAWAAPGFSHASCETPAFKAFMLARLGHGRSTVTGQLMPTRFDFGPITAARTVSNTGTVISCEISVDLDTRGGTRSIHGRFTASRGPKGGGWRWQPGY